MLEYNFDLTTLQSNSQLVQGNGVFRPVQIVQMDAFIEKNSVSISSAKIQQKLLFGQQQACRWSLVPRTNRWQFVRNQ